MVLTALKGRAPLQVQLCTCTNARHIERVPSLATLILSARPMARNMALSRCWSACSVVYATAKTAVSCILFHAVSCMLLGLKLGVVEVQRGDV